MTDEARWVLAQKIAAVSKEPVKQAAKRLRDAEDEQVQPVMHVDLATEM